MKNELTLTGRVVFRFTKPDGSERVIHKNNMVMLAGKAWLASRAVGRGSDMTHVAFGSAPAESNQDMLTLECEELRVPIEHDSFLANTFSYVVSFQPGEALSFKELGLFDQSRGGLMFARIAYEDGISKAEDEKLELTWTVTVS